MFIHLTAYHVETMLLINLNQVTAIHPDNNGSKIFFEGENYILVRETVEDLYDRIRSMSNGK